LQKEKEHRDKLEAQKAEKLRLEKEAQEKRLAAVREE
jgi:hypothetical protein